MLYRLVFFRLALSIRHPPENGMSVLMVQICLALMGEIGYAVSFAALFWCLLWSSACEVHGGDPGGLEH